MRIMGRLSLAAVVAMAAAVALTFGAAAQNRQFSFAYDQPKGSGYDAGADMFNNKLMELSKGTLSINKYPGAQLGTEAQTMQKVQTATSISYSCRRPMPRPRSRNPACSRFTSFSMARTTR
jgi:TRAP-type C4-dicarboxylate transport system substrate-binding protein